VLIGKIYGRYSIGIMDIISEIDFILACVISVLLTQNSEIVRLYESIYSSVSFNILHS